MTRILFTFFMIYLFIDLYLFIHLFAGTKTSKQIKCGTNGCQIDRTHCNNNMSYTSFVPWITDTLPLTTGVVEVTGGGK